MDILQNDMKHVRLDELTKKPRRRRRWLIWLLLFLVIGIGSFAGLIYFSPQPPVAAFGDARKMLGQARQAEAGTYAPDLFAMAEERWQEANSYWRSENSKWFFMRSFGSALSSANSARTLAQSAAERAVLVRDSLSHLAALGIQLVKAQVNELRPEFQTLPVPRAHREPYVAGELLILESEAAFERGDYISAVEKFYKAAANIDVAGEKMTKTVDGYLAGLPTWRRWAEETVSWSRANDAAAIVVDKMAHKCKLYYAGKLKAEYECELGPQWLGPKLHEGDKATPEGRYSIRKKKSGSQTKYYKALLIDYPNETDRAKFAELKRRGMLSSRARIGGLIEVHGDGGRGVNWTSGCVALRNEHMDEVFAIATVGTPITIVGSLSGSQKTSSDSVDQFRKSVQGATNRAALQQQQGQK